MSDDLAERIERCAAMLRAYCAREGIYISPDDRVTEDHAAAMLGIHPGTLANQRAAGTSPPWYRIRYGCRVTYRLQDLAAHIEAGRVENTLTE